MASSRGAEQAHPVGSASAGRAGDCYDSAHLSQVKCIPAISGLLKSAACRPAVYRSEHTPHELVRLLLQLVVASPLTRTLETAVGVFGAGRWRAGKGSALMLEQTGKDHLRAPHAAVAAPEGIRFVSFEGCRERLGTLPGLLLPSSSQPGDGCICAVACCKSHRQCLHPY